MPELSPNLPRVSQPNNNEARYDAFAPEADKARAIGQNKLTLSVDSGAASSLSSASSREWMEHLRQQHTFLPQPPRGGAAMLSAEALERHNALNEANARRRDIHVPVVSNRVDPGVTDASSAAPEAEDTGRVTADQLEIHAPGSRALRRIYTGVTGTIGAAVGFVVGSVVGSFAFAGPGTVVGAIVGAGEGAAFGMGGGLVGARLHRFFTGGQGQQAHIDQAKEMLATQGVTFSAKEVANLEQISAKEWRALLHVPRNAVSTPAGGMAQGMSKKEQRQAIREALILTAAKKGKAAAEILRQNLFSSHLGKGVRAHHALQIVNANGGNVALREAFRTGGDEQLARVRYNQAQNREAWSTFRDEIHSRFGDVALAKDMFDHFAERIRLGAPLTDKDRRQVVGALKHQRAMGEILQRAADAWGQTAVIRPMMALHKDLKQMAEGKKAPAAFTAETGCLKEEYTRALLQGAWNDAVAAQGPNAPEPEPTLDAMLAKEARISTLQRLLGSTGGRPAVDSSDPHPVDVFAGDTGLSLAETCETLLDMDVDSTLAGLATGDAASDDAHGARLQTARSVAALGKMLLEGGVDEADARELVLMDLGLRMAHGVPADGAPFRPEIADEDGVLQADQRERAQQNAADRANLRTTLAGDPALDGITQRSVDAVADRLLVEAMAKAGTPQRLSALTDPAGHVLMADNAAGLKAVILAGVDVGTVMRTMRVLGGDGRLGSVEEAISCLRLQVTPQTIAGTDMTALSGWTDAGFNRAEAIAYADHVFQPGQIRGGGRVALAPSDPQMQAFAGSGLRPSEAQQYLDYGIKYNAFTAPTFFTDAHLKARGASSHGGINNVHTLIYDTPTGDQARYFKGARPERGLQDTDPGKLVGANLGMGVVDRALGFDVIVDTKVAFNNGQLGISMADAGKYDALKLNNYRMYGVPPNMFHSFTRSAYLPLPRDDPSYAPLYDRLKQEGGTLSEQDRQDLADLYNLEDIRVTEQGDLEVAQGFMNAAFTDPVLQEKTVALQIVDFLCDLKDRNISNYVPDIQIAPNGLENNHINVKARGVKGIDNDDAFNAMATNTNSLGLPPVMSRAQRAAINRVYENREQVKADLAKVVKSSPNRDEMEGFESRLETLHRYANGRIRVGGNRVQIVRNDAWGSVQVSESMTNPSRTLIARDA